MNESFGKTEFHIIRLHGPWHVEVLHCSEDASAQVDAAQNIKLPGPWRQTLGDSFVGRVGLVRRFGYPAGLAASQKVWLAIESYETSATVFLNDKRLGALIDGKLREEVGHQLDLRNRLRLEIECRQKEDVGRAASIDSVRLEIEESASFA